jgi:LmbE family N-acetylglucosaminyl deacetylase
MNEGKILGKKIMIITAHPDDETFTAAGTIYQNNKAGGSAFVVCATLGEKGRSHLEEELDEGVLAEVRRQELNSVLELLGVQKNNIHIFTYPDTDVRSFCDQIKEKILALVNIEQPDLIMSFDEHGLTGHQDHVAIGGVARDIATELQLPLATFTLPAQLLIDNPNLFQKQQRHGKYISTIKFKEPNVVIEVDNNLKENALCLHKSQYGTKDPLRSLPESVAECVLHKEYFFLEE